MARKRNMSAEARLDQCLHLYLEALKAEGTGLECPKCNQPTLLIELVGGSGLQVTCKGIDEDDDDGLCSFKKYALLTKDEELPKIVLKTVEGETDK